MHNEISTYFLLYSGYVSVWVLGGEAVKCGWILRVYGIFGIRIERAKVLSRCIKIAFIIFILFAWLNTNFWFNWSSFRKSSPFKHKQSSFWSINHQITSWEQYPMRFPRNHHFPRPPCLLFHNKVGKYKKANFKSKT